MPGKTPARKDDTAPSPNAGESRRNDAGLMRVLRQLANSPARQKPCTADWF